MRRESVKEPGIARFDLMQQTDDSTLCIVEAYRDANADGETQIPPLSNLARMRWRP